MKLLLLSRQFRSQLLFCSTTLAIALTNLTPLDLNHSTLPLKAFNLITRDLNLIVEVSLTRQILPKDLVKTVIALAEDDIRNHKATDAMQEAEIGFSCADPVLHQRVFFYFRKGSPYGTSWGNWSDALDTIAGYVASEFTDQALNFSVKSLIKGSTVGGSGKLIGLPEFVDSVGGTGA